MTTKPVLIRKRKGASAPAPTGAATRWMTVAAWAVGLLLLGASLTWAALWIGRSPAWTFKHVDLLGDLTRNNAITVRANTLPRLNGNFFSLDLEQAQHVFESVPWVRSAMVRRVWPDRLVVRLQEHRPVARWIGADGHERLVNTFGEVFDANLGEVDGDALPTFSGPDSQVQQVLRMFLKLSPVFASLDRRIARLDVSGRGSWALVLDDETEITIGRGGAQDVIDRAERFVSTITQVTSHYKTALLQADLRHQNGYAVQLKGVTSVEPSTKKEGK